MLSHLDHFKSPFLNPSNSLNERIKQSKTKLRRVMEDCTKNSKRIAGTLEKEEASSTSLVSKRPKFTSQQLKELKYLPPTNIELEHDHLLLLSPDKTTTSSDFFSSSRCSSNDSLEILKDSSRFADLEATSFETEASTFKNNNKLREASPLSEICGDSEEISMDSPAKKPPESSRRNSPAEAAANMPSLAEIDEFFSVAEKYEQKRFAEKYNYDIVKEVPLEGRYQWVRLKP